MNKSLITLAVTLLIAAPAYADGHKHTGKMESCMRAALAAHPGDVISLEAEIENGKPIYEFDIKGKDGKEWEVECNAKSGKITEVEEEVEASAPGFASKAKVSFDDARKKPRLPHIRVKW